MNAQELAQELIDDARAKAKRIEEETVSTLREFDKETDALVLRKRRTFIDNATRLEEEQKKQQEARRQKQAQLQLLTCKQELIDEVFEEAKKKLARLSAKQRTAVLDRLWKQAEKEIDVATVVVAKKDKAFFSKKAKVSGTTNNIGGFIAENKEGTVRINFTFETLLRSIKEQHVQDVAGILWRRR